MPLWEIQWRMAVRFRVRYPVQNRFVGFAPSRNWVRSSLDSKPLGVESWKWNAVNCWPGWQRLL